MERLDSLLEKFDWEAPGFCSSCHKRLYKGDDWFTCSICGKPVCEVCRRGHVTRCMAVSWDVARENPETGELEPTEKPPEYAIGD